jgi:anti-anti-sigma factor
LKEAEVGGDFYDLFPLPDGRMGLLLGDVSGKGLKAAVYATMTRYMARAYALETGSPAAVLAQVNRGLCESLDDPCLFVTAFYAVLDPKTGRLDYANAGHWPPLVGREQSVRPLPGRSLPLGVAPEASYKEGQFQLRPGDGLVIFTDGLVEIDNDDPMRHLEALRETLVQLSGEPPQALVEALHRYAHQARDGGLRDDVAILALRCDNLPCPVPLVPAAPAATTVIPPPPVVPKAEKLVLQLGGEIDVTNAAAVEAELCRLTGQRPQVLVIDLEQVTFLDSAGVRLILQAHRWQQAAGNAVEIIPGEGIARHVLTHCRLVPSATPL